MEGRRYKLEIGDNESTIKRFHETWMGKHSTSAKLEQKN